MTEINRWAIEKQVSSIYGPYLDFVAKQLVGLTTEAMHDKLNAMFAHNDSNLDLLKFSDLTVSDQRSTRLLAGELVYLQEDGSLFGLMVQNTGHVITMSLTQSESQAKYRQARGPMKLIKNELMNYPESGWMDAITEMERTFGHSIAIIDDITLEKIKKQKNIITYKELLWHEDDEQTTLISPISEGLYIMVGPIKDGVSNGPMLIAWISSLIFIFFIIVMVSLIWLWPLYRDHKKLNQLAEAFGLGNLDVRVNLSKGSFSKRLGLTFNQMADNIQRLIKSNQQVINAVAHDLRTPLTRVRFALAVLENDHSPKSKAKHSALIETSLGAIEELIQQSLVYARYNQVANLENFSHSAFCNLIKSEVKLFQMENPGHVFIIEIAENLQNSTQELNEKAMIRALRNLISNAITFAEKQIHISYQLTEGYLVLAVSDDGPGVDEHHKEKVLEPFFQVDNQARTVNQGHGLGLSIVNQIAKWHGGGVSITDSEWGGACISIRVPHREGKTTPSSPDSET